MIGLVGMKDPVRPGVREAVCKCREAGVQVRMMTRDSRSIAISIAK
jgi:Ca2+-transporting ATPase